MSKYIAPDDVHSPRKQWNLIKVLRNQGEGDYALAIGRWERNLRLAIRWNGTKNNPIGNPQSRGLSTWFMVPKDFEEPIIKTLTGDELKLARNFFTLR